MVNTGNSRSRCRYKDMCVPGEMPLPWLTWPIIVIILVGMLIYFAWKIWKCCLCFWKDNDDEEDGKSGWLTCSLCKEKVNPEDFTEAKHRRECVSKHIEELKQMPEPFDVHCGRCGNRLKEWSVVGRFLCNGCNETYCLTQSDKHYRCFLCDFDMCYQCVLTRPENV